MNRDGSLGPRNDLRSVSLEHKLGIHASPTCVMSFGDDGQCVGYQAGVACLAFTNSALPLIRPANWISLT